jgi:fructose-bisphosphate aldolase class II
LKAAGAAASEICKERFQSFGSSGKISTIKVMSLDKISEMYSSGQLTPVVV